MGTKSGKYVTLECDYVQLREGRWYAGVRDRGSGTVVHLEAYRLVAAPPAAQARSVAFFAAGFFLHIYDAVLFVHKEAGDGARAGVHVLVVAPGGEVDVPVVQFDVDVANGVREVPAD